MITQTLTDYKKSVTVDHVCKTQKSETLPSAKFCANLLTGLEGLLGVCEHNSKKCNNTKFFATKQPIQILT